MQFVCLMFKKKYYIILEFSCKIGTFLNSSILLIVNLDVCMNMVSVLKLIP